MLQHDSSSMVREYMICRSQWPRGLRRLRGLRPLLPVISGSSPVGGHECLCVVSCQIEVPVTGWSLVQRSPFECGVSECDHETSTVRRPWPTSGCCAMGRNVYNIAIKLVALDTTTSIRLCGSNSMTLLLDGRHNSNCHRLLITGKLRCYIPPSAILACAEFTYWVRVKVSLMSDSPMRVNWILP